MFCEFEWTGKCDGEEVEVVVDGDMEVCLCVGHITVMERECRIVVVGEVFV